jgi:hypothetical protein
MTLLTLDIISCKKYYQSLAPVMGAEMLRSGHEGRD